MMYFCILFASPLYFMIRGKWAGAALNFVFFGLAWLFLITIIGAMIAPIFWILAVGHAGYYLRRENMAEHADMVATKMAEKLREAAQKAPPVIYILALSAILAFAGCATKVGQATFPEAQASFTPKQTYKVSYDKLWEATSSALEKNRIATVSADKISGVIQTDYIEGQSALIGFGFIGAQSTRYKYNVTVRNQAGGDVKLLVLCKIESTMKGGSGASQWTDVSSQNGERLKKLEAWLYQEIEKGLL